MSVSVEYNNREINEIVIKNILKMIERRGIIDSSETEFKKISTSDFQNKNIFELDKIKIEIYLVNAKLTTISQGHPLDIYLSNNLNIHKIIIAKDVSKKVVKQIANDYKNAEYWFEKEMLIEFPGVEYVPEHKIITGEERAELLEKFNENDLAYILLADMGTRYYGGKVGDILKIIRPSSTAGKSMFYRRVINSSWDNLF